MTMGKRPLLFVRMVRPVYNALHQLNNAQGAGINLAERVTEPVTDL